MVYRTYPSPLLIIHPQTSKGMRGFLAINGKLPEQGHATKRDIAYLMVAFLSRRVAGGDNDYAQFVEEDHCATWRLLELGKREDHG